MAKGGRGGQRGKSYKDRNITDPFMQRLKEIYGEYVDQAHHIKNYVGTDDYAGNSVGLNRALSNAGALGIDATTLKKYGEQVRGLDSAMNISPLEKNMTLYRGTQASLYKNVKVGDIIQPNVYMSTSESQRIAKRFVIEDIYGNVSDKNVILEINAKKGTPSINVAKALGKSNSSSARVEQERLLSRNLKYKVIEKQGSVIKLEVVS